MMVKKQRIGIDYDGTIADTLSMKSKWIRSNLGREIPPWRTDRSRCIRFIGKDNYERMSADVYERDLTLAAPEVPGAYYALYRLSRSADVYLVTVRPEPRIKFAQEWLENLRALEYFTSLVSITRGNTIINKAQICEELDLDIIIDDEERHLVEIRKQTRRILLKNACQESLEIPRGIELARSWEEVLTMLGYR